MIVKYRANNKQKIKSIVFKITLLAQKQPFKLRFGLYFYRIEICRNEEDLLNIFSAT